MLLTTVYGLASVAIAGSTFLSGSTAERSWQGVLVGVANLVAAYLAWHRSTRQEIELTERRRAVRS